GNGEAQPDWRPGCGFQEINNKKCIRFQMLVTEGENLTKNLLARPRSGALGEGEELEFGTSPGVFSAQKRPVDRDTVEGNSPHEGDASSRLRPEGCQPGAQAVAPGAPAGTWRAIQI